MLESLVGLDAGTTARLLGLLVPLLVALITKKFASPGLKGFLNLVVSAVVGSTVYLVAENGGYNWLGFVNGALDTFIVSVIAYYGVLKPTGIASTVSDATAGFGLGDSTVTTNDAGAALLGTVGGILVLIGGLFLLLTLLNVYVVSTTVCVIAIVIGIILVVVDRGGMNV